MVTDQASNWLIMMVGCWPQAFLTFKWTLLVDEIHSLIALWYKNPQVRVNGMLVKYFS